MSVQDNSYEFGAFRLDDSEKTLTHRGEAISITPKVFETLLLFLANAGHLIEKDELIRQLWPDRFVEESNLTFNIKMLRKALGDDASKPTFIETVPKRGYRFIAKVRTTNGSEETGIARGHLRTEDLPSISLGRGQQATVAALNHSRRQQTTGPHVAAGQAMPLVLVPPQKPVVKTQTLLVAALCLLTIFMIGISSYLLTLGRSDAGLNGKKTIAVLPVKPINATNREAIYEIGITDSLIQRISLMTGLFPRPLSATRKYVDLAQDPLAAGREQKVDYVITSSYQLNGGKIRVTAQLINVATGITENTHTSETDATDHFAMQDAIAAEIGENLLLQFDAASLPPTAKRRTLNKEAYLLYWQGKNLIYNWSIEDTRKAIECFRKAVQLDPEFAAAYSGLAHAYIISGNLRGGSSSEYEMAHQSVAKALELDNNLAEGFAVSGELKFSIGWDYPAAERDIIRAIQLEPNSNFAHQQYASYLAARGLFDEAVAESDIAIEIDPNSYSGLQNRGRILYLARRYDEAIAQFNKVSDMYPASGVHGGWLWVSHEMKGDHTAAYAVFMNIQERVNPALIPLYQAAYETGGWRGVRQKVLDLQMINEQTHSTNYYGLARQCALLGKKEEAFAYLNKAIENRAGQLQMLNVEPPFDSLRDDPRFDAMVRRVGL